MAIYEVTELEVLQCCESCGQERRIALATLSVGGARDEHVDERLVPLPACPQCGSTEFLFRRADVDTEHPSPGSFGHLHRMLVDHLHAILVGHGQVATKLSAADRRIARPVGEDARARWFANGMKIPGSDSHRPHS